MPNPLVRELAYAKHFNVTDVIGLGTFLSVKCTLLLVVPATACPYKYTNLSQGL